MFRNRLSASVPLADFISNNVDEHGNSLKVQSHFLQWKPGCLIDLLIGNSFIVRSSSGLTYHAYVEWMAFFKEVIWQLGWEKVYPNLHILPSTSDFTRSAMATHCHNHAMIFLAVLTLITMFEFLEKKWATTWQIQLSTTKLTRLAVVTDFCIWVTTLLEVIKLTCPNGSP